MSVVAGQYRRHRTGAAGSCARALQLAPIHMGCSSGKLDTSRCVTECPPELLVLGSAADLLGRTTCVSVKEVRLSGWLCESCLQWIS